MTSLLNFILWNPDTTALHLGPFDVRWYGLCWITGLALAYFLVSLKTLLAASLADSVLALCPNLLATDVLLSILRVVK